MADDTKSPDQPAVDATPSDSVPRRDEPDAIPSVVMVRVVEQPPEAQRFVAVQRRPLPWRTIPVERPAINPIFPPWVDAFATHVMGLLGKFSDSDGEELTASQIAEMELKEKAREGAKTEREKNKLAFYFGIAALVIIVIITGMALDKDSIVSDIVKVGLGAVVGGAGGYGIGISKSKKKGDDD